MLSLSLLKIIALTAIVGLGLFAGKCGADTRQSSPAEPVIQIDGGEIRGEAADEAMQKFAASLHREPHARMFRVTWTLSIGGWGSIGTALYDRHKQTIKFFCSGGEQFGDALYEHYLYTGVTDGIIEQVAEKFASPGGGSSDGFFDKLSAFGCGFHPYRDNRGIIRVKYKQNASPR